MDYSPRIGERQTALGLKEAFKAFKENLSVKPAESEAGPSQAIISTMRSSLSPHFWELPWNPDALYQKRGDYKIYDDMREDDQVSAMLRLKKISLIGTGWSIQTDDEQGEKEPMEFLHWALEDAQQTSFDRTLYGILSAIDYGFSITEKVFAKAEMDGREKWIFGQFLTRRPDGFTFDVDEHGTLIALKQNYNALEPKEKFIHYVHNPEFENPYGESDLNMGVYRAWWSKNHVVKFMNMFLERFGMPFVVGSYDRNTANLQDMQKIESILKNLQARTGITSPNDVKWELKEASRAGADGFLMAINHYNTMIARAMLVPDLVGMAGQQTSGGSYALGQQQFDLFYKTLQAERNQLERMINTHIIRPLLSWNFPNADKITARFYFNPLTDEEKYKLTERWTAAVQAGAVKPTTSQEVYVAKLLGFPEPTSEEMQEIEQRKEDMDKIREQGVPANEKPNQEKEPEEKEPPKEMIDHEHHGISLTRELTTYERKVNFAEITRATEKIEHEAIVEISRVFKRALNSVVDTAVEKKVLETKNIGWLKEFKIPFYAQFKAALKDGLEQAYRLGRSSGKSEMARSFALLEEDIGGLTPMEARALLNEVASRVADDEWENLRKLSTPVFENAIKEGLPWREVSKQLEKAFAGYDLANDSFRLETQIRVNFNKVFNEGRMQEYRKAWDQVEAFQYSAIMDGRTTELCTSLDGKIFSKGDAAKFNPPNHFNCRSLLVPILTGETFELSKMPDTEMEPGGFLRLT